MLTIGSFFSNFFFLFFLLFHLGCFTFSSRHHDTSSLFKKKRPPPKTTVFSYLKRLFSSSSSSPHIPPPPPPSFPSPSSSTRSLRLKPPLIVPLAPHTNTTRHDIAPDIHPCSVCGEIFQSPSSLEHHQSTKHAVSELVDGENIVRIIFKMGWPEKKAATPTIHRILKIHNAPKVVARFEEHRESVKSKAAAAAAAKIKNILIRDERCAADGNELLRFYCTTFICGLDSTICSHQFCSACGIIRYGFSQKLDGIPTLPTSWKAHAAVPDDIEEEFSFMHVKRALLVCRVIAGRVGSDPGVADGFDSLVGPGSGGFGDELLVFNPRAVLPCFVIVYTVV